MNKRSTAAKPKISVALPMYNAAEFLPACLDSLLAQTMGDFEIVAVDDCSTDETPEIAARCAARDTRIRVFRQDKNSNAFATRMAALERAAGDYVFCCDADDTVPPDAFKLLLDRAERTGADIVHGRARYFSGAETLEPAYFFDPFRVETGEEFALATLRNARGWSVWGKLISRRTVDRALPSFPRGRHWFSLDDLLTSCLFGMHAAGYAALNRTAYLYRVPPVTHSTRAGGFDKWANDTLGIMTFFEETVASERGEGALLEGVRSYMRDCLTGLLAESSREPAAFAAVVEKIRATALPAHVQWAEKQGLFTIDAAKKRGKAGLAGRLCASARRARERGFHELCLRIPIKLSAWRRERAYRAAARAEENT